MENWPRQVFPTLMEKEGKPAQWVLENSEFLYRYALLHLRDISLAEDAVQETLLAALNADGAFEGRSSERTWLIGILKHKILDHFRKKEREISRFEVLENREEVPDFDLHGKWREPPSGKWCDPLEMLDRKRFWEGLSDCLANLPAKMERVFILREIDGLPIEEICEAFKITSANCRVLLYRARMQLRRCLEAKGVQKT